MDRNRKKAIADIGKARASIVGQIAQKANLEVRLLADDLTAGERSNLRGRIRACESTLDDLENHIKVTLDTHPGLEE